MYDASFYVMSSAYNVYKCIRTGRNSSYTRVASTVEPTGTAVLPITTGDGYMWKYILKAKYWDKSGIPLRLFKPTTKSTMLSLTPLIKNALKDVGVMNLYIYRENLGDYDPDIVFFAVNQWSSIKVG